MVIQLIAAFLAVFCFSITLEIPKKFTIMVGVIGGIGWIRYLLGIKNGLSPVFSSFISAFIVAIISGILSKIFNCVTTIFFIPGTLPIVPGLAMYRTLYAVINNDTSSTIMYLMQTLLIAGVIALAVFITESIQKLKIKTRKEIKNENTI